ncbi:MAG TPA: alpha/beta hydrolase [Nitrososphaeraceae archaeon]|nr:alpha/beta hydrolase [Nitrososphaeraceae archaeon]
MKTNNNRYILLILPVILYFVFLAPRIGLNHIPLAYSQNQSSSFQAEVKALDDMPSQKVKVGDIDTAYKQLGKLGNANVNPIVLITGASTTMDMWSPTLLKELSSNRSVIIFDNRGAGESTAGTKEFSINQFANDTIGLLDALNIERADILGSSMGSFIAQELALKYPNRVNNLILSASSCGGNEAVPPGPQVLQALDMMTSNMSSPPTQEDIDRITSTLFPPEWLSANPNYQNYIPLPQESVSPEILQRQNEAIISWITIGTCNALSNITQPTLVLVGTDDIWTPAANSLMIAERIPGAWLVQIKDAGHGLMYQYPDKFSNVISTFLQVFG